MLELLVVFVGVYAASMFAGRQARQAEVERTEALRRALTAELAFIHEKGQEIELSELIVYADAMEGGRTPALQPFASRIPFTPDVWEAALASGGVQLLDPELVIQLAEFYGGMRAFISELDSHRAYVREVLLPNLHQPLAEFYDEGGTIRPKYRWYLEHLRWLPEEAQRLTDLAGDLHATLSGDS